MTSRIERTGSRPRRGMTLVELIIAMSLLTIGLLGIVGVSAGIGRSLGESRSDNLAAVRAQSRFEAVAGMQCNSLAIVGQGGTESSRNITEVWKISDGGNNTLLVTDTVTWITRKGTRKQAFKTLLPCRNGA